MRYHCIFNRKTETKFTGARAGVCGELGHSTSNSFPTVELLGQRITVLEGLKEGDVGKKRLLFLSSSTFLPCFCAQFRYCLLSPGFYSSCEGSLPVVIVKLIFLSVGKRDETSNSAFLPVSLLGWLLFLTFYHES